MSSVQNWKERKQRVDAEQARIMLQDAIAEELAGKNIRVGDRVYPLQQQMEPIGSVKPRLDQGAVVVSIAPHAPDEEHYDMVLRTGTGANAIEKPGMVLYAVNADDFDATLAKYLAAVDDPEQGEAMDAWFAERLKERGIPAP